MSVSQFNQLAYGRTQPEINIFPAPIVSNRVPTTSDKAVIGSTWIDKLNNNYYVLTNIVNNLANWVLLAAGSGNVDQLTSDAGVALPAGGNINVFGAGSTNIHTTGAGSTLTVAVISSPSFAGTVTAATGFTATTGNITASTGNFVATLGGANVATTVVAGTGVTATTGNITASTGNIVATAGSVSANTTVSAGTTLIGGTGLTVSAFTAGVVQSSAIGVFSSSNGTNGQVLIGGGTNPTWATITPGANITVTNAANSITIAAFAGAATLNYTSTSTTPYVVAASDDYVSMDATAGIKTVQLPNAPATGRIFVIKDQVGIAGTNNITVTTVGGAVNIDGATSFVMNVNYQSIQVIFNGASYEIY